MFLCTVVISEISWPSNSLEDLAANGDGDRTSARFSRLIWSLGYGSPPYTKTFSESGIRFLEKGTLASIHPIAAPKMNAILNDNPDVVYSARGFFSVHYVEAGFPYHVEAGFPLHVEAGFPYHVEAGFPVIFGLTEFGSEAQSNPSEVNHPYSIVSCVCVPFLRVINYNGSTLSTSLSASAWIPLSTLLFCPRFFLSLSLLILQAVKRSGRRRPKGARSHSYNAHMHTYTLLNAMIYLRAYE